MLIDKNELIKVTNRDNGTVGYTIPDLGNLHRNFQPRETKEITMEELRKLSYLPGGQTLLEDCLIIQNEAAITELLGGVEPEYYYTEDEIKELLLRGNILQLKDCLNFAPQGVIDLVKTMAVDLKINDLDKREAILEKTGFNVSKAIEINQLANETDNSENEQKQRRQAAPIRAKADSNAAPTRFAPPPQYNVTSMSK